MEILIWQFIKFCIVGSLGLIIDFGTTYFMKESIRINKYLAHSTGFTLAVIHNYLLNKHWTFGDQDPDLVTQGSKFLVIAVVGLIVSNQLIYLFHNRYSLNFYISKLLAIFVVVVWNFTANYFFTFST